VVLETLFLEVIPPPDFFISIYLLGLVKLGAGVRQDHFASVVPAKRACM
jgi:hypothetical protein